MFILDSIHISHSSTINGDINHLKLDYFVMKDILGKTMVGKIELSIFYTYVFCNFVILSKNTVKSKGIQFMNSDRTSMEGYMK